MLAWGVAFGAVLLVELWLVVHRVRRRSLPTDLSIMDADITRGRGTADDLGRELSRQERTAVRRAVSKGRAVDGPRLAAAAVARAHWQGLMARMSIARPRWIGGLPWVFIGLSALARVSDDDSDFFRGFNLVVVILAPVAIVLVVSEPVWRARRAADAVRLNFRVLVRDSTA